MRGARARLALLAAGLVALYAVFGVARVVEPAEVERAVRSAGGLAPLAFVSLSALLGALLLPGPLLSAAAGLLFGLGLGFVLALSATVGSALIGLVVGRAAGPRARSGRALALERWLARRGLWAVVAQRLLPGVPDGPVNYAAGAAGVRARHLALGTALGSAPRAFAYTALGATLDDLASPLALVALGVLGAALVAGALLARRALRADARS
ncbi:MAG: VTT domain-containing protein [Actinomycetota bacterium]|nr:VTT domain-containing protein [Actinomycetota bacterium]